MLAALNKFRRRPERRGGEQETPPAEPTGLKAASSRAFFLDPAETAGAAVRVRRPRLSQGLLQAAAPGKFRRSAASAIESPDEADNKLQARSHPHTSHTKRKIVARIAIPNPAETTKQQDRNQASIQDHNERHG